MLRIERVEICGFKSFCDKTEVQFPPGITAIVGPNGCGKSNVGDAINWVLGEQSPKTLRGQQMADVIFNGSQERKPLGLAEVSLVLAGAEGLPENEQGRVTFTRRLFRSGESEYLLNGSRARLKDIQELLRQARVGARTYATIEQGRIDQVLNAKPQDRRALIEDAAGVSGYKHKRRLAELKLEATHANLLRVHDVITEVERQVRSLKRQAARARRYRRLREALRETECVRFARKAREMDQELGWLRQTEGRVRDEEAETTARLGRLEVELQQQREALDQTGRARRLLAEQQHEAHIGIDRSESQVRSCRERIAESEQSAMRAALETDQLAAKLRQAEDGSRLQQAAVAAGQHQLQQLMDQLSAKQGEIQAAELAGRALSEDGEGLRRRQFEAMSQAAELRNRARGILDVLQRVTGQGQRLRSEQAEVLDDRVRGESQAQALALEVERQQSHLEQLRAARSRNERMQLEARERHEAGQQALAQGREHETSAMARLATLEDLETRFAGVSDGVKSLLASGTTAGIRTHGVVADYIEASREVEGAAEGYLQWLLPTVILEDDGDARRAVDLLRHEGSSRTWLISRTQPAGALVVGSAVNGRADFPVEMLHDSRVLGRLRDRLTLKTAANGVLADRIGDAVLVDTLQSALDLHRRYPRLDFLTAQGEVVYASGLISAGGDRANGAGLLAHKRRVRETQIELGEAAQHVASLQAEVEVGRRDVQQLEETLRDQLRELEEAERRQLELQLHVERSAEKVERSDRRSAVLFSELAGLDEEELRLKQALGEVGEQVGRAEELERDLEGRLRAQAQQAQVQVEQLRQLAEDAAQLRANLAAERQRHESAEQERERIATQLTELTTRAAAAVAERSAAQARASEALELLSRTEGELVGYLQQREQLAREASELDSRLAQQQESIPRLESELRAARTQLDALREATRAAEVERARCEAARQHLDELCRQELGTSAGEAAEIAGERAAEVELGSLEEKVQQLRQQIEEIGPVNMTAIDEFTELERRRGFLTTQREDLEQSMNSLREAIRRINRQSREHFSAAFEAIRLGFREIYQSLFNGGSADLRLEEGEDVLECGIEILAQPPGKRLAGVQLLSGGEKALSAIALLFAVFRYQPSPFCLLDEVDAALDDTNVGRFTRMLRDYAQGTQFIIITHNKLSMEAANLLYGVTMQEPGVSKIVSLRLE